MCFVIENYSDIKALEDIVTYTQERLPRLVNNEVASAILELESTYFADQGCQVERDPGKEIWWGHPQIYNLAANQGLFFEFAHDVTWLNLWEGNPDNAPYLFLYANTHEGTKKSRIYYVDQWVKVLKAKKHELREKGIILQSEVGLDYDDPLLASYPLHQEINMTTLTNLQGFRQQIQAAVKTFTSTLLSILLQSDQVSNLKSS